jgi:O-antigen/teichoic acid export membrane protein
MHYSPHHTRRFTTTQRLLWLGFEMKQQILSLGKDSLIYGVGSVITRFFGLFTLPLFTAYLTPTEYGVLAMLALLTMVVQPIFSLALAGAMGQCYFERDDFQYKSTVVWTTFLIHTLSSAFMIIVAWTYPASIAKLVRLSAEHNQLIGLSLTGCAFTIITIAIAARVQFEKQAKLYVVVTLITAGTSILVSILTVVFWGWGVKGMVIGQLTSNIVTFFGFLFIALKNTKPITSSVMAKKLLRHGFPLIPAFAFLFVISNGNKYILEWKLGLEAVGIYSIGFNIGMTISIITGSISTAWFPFFLNYMNRESEAAEIFSRILTCYIFGVGLLSLFYFIFAKLVVISLTQEAYHDAYHLVGFIAISQFSLTLFGFFLPWIYFNKEVKYVSIIQGATALLSLPLNYYLIIEMGTLGAAIGLAMSNILMAALLYGWNVFNKSRYPRIKYEWGRVFRFFAMALLIYVVNENILTTTMVSEILKAVTIAALALITTFFLLSHSEKNFLLSRFNYSGQR